MQVRCKSDVNQVRVQREPDVRPMCVRFKSDVSPMRVQREPIMNPMCVRRESDVSSMRDRCESDVSLSWMVFVFFLKPPYQSQTGLIGKYLKINKARIFAGFGGISGRFAGFGDSRGISDRFAGFGASRGISDRFVGSGASRVISCYSSTGAVWIDVSARQGPSLARQGALNRACAFGDFSQHVV